jgi:hypothetical protein
MNTFIEELISVARQAVEYTKEFANKPHFVAMAEDVLTVAEAIQIAMQRGHTEGWDVFEIGNGCWAIQSDDNADKIDDIQAIELARRAGIRIDDDGNLIDKNGNIISQVGISVC